MLLCTINHNKVDAEHRVELLSNLYLDMIDVIRYDQSQKVDAEHRVELLSNLCLDMIDVIRYDRWQYEADRCSSLSFVW